MRKILLIFTVMLLVSNCFADSLITRFANGVVRQSCRISGDVSSFGTSVCNPCCMTYSIIGVQALQCFTAYKWLFSGSNADEWHNKTKQVGWVRSALCISYVVYGLFPDNKINTQTAATYYCLSLTF